MTQESRDPHVRIAELEIDTAQADAFAAAVREVGQVSVRSEDGCLVLYAVAATDNPGRVRVFEIYRDAAAYQAHLLTPHFRKFRETTDAMVKSRKLMDVTAISLAAKPGMIWSATMSADEQLANSAAAASVTSRATARVAPALQSYSDGVLSELWRRPGLSARDRSIVTAAAVIARDQTIEMPREFRRALDNGVKPSELSEIITHLAFYSGWGNAMAAVAAAEEVFVERKIGTNELPAAHPPLLPLDATAEAQRAATVEQSAGSVSPGLVKYTGEVLFRDLWLRPGLSPRDRSLVTVCALVASGQVPQITFHLNRAMDNGLTKTEASEVLAHLAFYAGWPNVFSAVPVAREVFEKRPR
jgi:4-carboxymuconolactone decarboxylase